MASSGLITPVTGRKYVKSWMIDEFIADALDFYRWTENLLDRKYFFPADIVRFLNHPESLIAWEKRKSDPDYDAYISSKRTENLDRLDRPYGIISGGYRLDTPAWLTDVRNYLSAKGLYKEEYIPLDQEFPEYSGVIYATGATIPSLSPGLIPNKGEALLVKMPDWKFRSVIKENVFFVPLDDDHLIWVGSYYEPWPKDPAPSVEGKRLLMKAIESIYTGPFTVIEHMSGVRPTIDDRRPLVGPFPGHEGKYLFNGMGTKGTSLAPYWAKHLISHLTEETPILKVVSPARYNTQP